LSDRVAMGSGSIRSSVDQVEDDMRATRSEVAQAVVDMKRGMTLVDEKMENEARLRAQLSARMEHLESIEQLVHALEGAIQVETGA